MKNKNAFSVIIFLLSLTSFGQEKTVRIVPLPKNQLQPVCILDGIKLPSGFIKDFFHNNGDIIDSVSIQLDSIFDCSGNPTNLGIVKVYSKDSVNSGAKRILTLTDNWLYEHPLTQLKINNTCVDWNENTYRKLIQLKPDDIIYAKIRKKGKCDMTLKLKTKE